MCCTPTRSDTLGRHAESRAATACRRLPCQRRHGAAQEARRNREPRTEDPPGSSKRFEEEEALHCPPHSRDTSDLPAFSATPESLRGPLPPRFAKPRALRPCPDSATLGLQHASRDGAELRHPASRAQRHPRGATLFITQMENRHGKLSSCAQPKP